MVVSGPFTSLWRREDGVAYIEFALLLPIFMGAFFASVELTRYININQKIEKATYQVADIISQSSTITRPELDTLMAAMEHLVQPYDFGDNSRVIISSISRASLTEGPRVRWQYCGGGMTGAQSEYGHVGSAAALPSGLSIEPKEDLIVAEFYYQFSPIITQAVVPSRRLRKFAITRPRLGALDGFTSNCSG